MSNDYEIAWEIKYIFSFFEIIFDVVKAEDEDDIDDNNEDEDGDEEEVSIEDEQV